MDINKFIEEQEEIKRLQKERNDKIEAEREHFRNKIIEAEKQKKAADEASS